MGGFRRQCALRLQCPFQAFKKPVHRMSDWFDLGRREGYASPSWNAVHALSSEQDYDVVFSVLRAASRPGLTVSLRGEGSGFAGAAQEPAISQPHE